ncbi:MAG TPA: glycosyltransferase [Hanamia sp.]|nr:glycosyltransferase [Hanamia sp.]
MKNNQPVLVILTPGFPKDESDTSCLPSQQIFIRSLNKIFPSLKIIILSFRYPFFTTAYYWHGNLVIPFNGTKKGIIAKMLLWSWFWRTLYKLKKENNIAGLFSFWCGECALIGKYFGKKNKLKHFSWLMGQDAKKGNKYIPLIRPKPDELIAMSDFLSQEFYKNYGIHTLQIIPNGIDASLFPALNAERDITILGAGSLIPLKQYDVFINIVKEIIEKMPGISVMLCGKGPQEIQLKQLIIQQKLQNNIVLTGEKPHLEILRFMQRTKIFLHTSSYEGFSTVCLEALYAGCHVISFIKPMLRDIDHWHIVQTKEEMIKKASYLLNDTTTQYKRVLVYSMDDSAKSVMNLFSYDATE